MASRANRSFVWDNFSKLSSTKVQCNLCKKELAVSGGVTTGMHAHLRSKHPSIVESSSSVKDGSATTMPITGFIKSRSCPDSRQERITEALAKVIAANMLPISIVESESMRNLLGMLEPGYKVPYRQTMTSRLEAMHRTVSNKLEEKLSTADSISVTTDIWTSLANEAYISFTATYVD